MKTFSKVDIAKSEIAKTGVKERLPVLADGQS